MAHSRYRPTGRPVGRPKVYPDGFKSECTITLTPANRAALLEYIDDPYTSLSVGVNRLIEGALRRDVVHTESRAGAVTNPRQRVLLDKDERARLLDEAEHATSLNARRRARAYLLLDHGPQGPGKSDQDVAEALHMNPRVIARFRRAYANKTPEPV